MRLFAGDLHRFCVGMLGDPAIAEDVVQTVFLQVHHDLAGFAAGASPRPWLYAIARNRCIDAARKRRRSRRLFGWAEAVPDPPDTSPSAEERLTALRSAASLEDCLRRLNDDDRSVVLMRFREQLTYEEIAGATGRTTGALRVRVARVMPRLRICLEGKGVRW